MVRLINKNNAPIIGKLLSVYTNTQKYATHILEVNQKNITPCIYAMWHSDQFCVYGIRDKGNLSILISTSVDGDIVDYASRSMGFKTVRGSSGKKGAVESSMRMVELLEKGETVAITVDGPRGPLHSVKPGIVRLAKLSGAPIVPVCWYCPQINFIHLPSWDGMTFPLGDTKILNLYGEPIYVPKDLPHEKEIDIRNQVKESLENIGKLLPKVYAEEMKKGSWKNLKQ